MTHAYHPACGCAACCDEELADERRDEYIEDFAPAVAKKLVGSEGFAWDVLSCQTENFKHGLIQDVGDFFEKFHNAPDNPEILSSLAVAFYKELLPIIEAAALDQAKSKVAAEFDKDLAA